MLKSMQPTIRPAVPSRRQQVTTPSTCQRHQVLGLTRRSLRLTGHGLGQDSPCPSASYYCQVPASSFLDFLIEELTPIGNCVGTIYVPSTRSLTRYSRSLQGPTTGASNWSCGGEKSPYYTGLRRDVLQVAQHRDCLFAFLKALRGEQSFCYYITLRYLPLL